MYVMIFSGKYISKGAIDIKIVPHFGKTPNNP